MGGQTATHASKGQTTGQAEVRSQASAPHIAGSGPQADVLDLQHAAGNRAVSGLVESSHTAFLGNDVPPSVRSVLNSSGQPLDPTTRGSMESRFGRDFSQVRVHTDTRAAESAQGVNAHAYTMGHDMVFGAGWFAPGTNKGRRLIAHELAHVVQQSRGGPPPPLSSDAPHERAADHAADAAMSGQTHVAVFGATGVGIARDEDDKKKRSSNEPIKQLGPVPAKQLQSGPVTVDEVMADPKARQQFAQVAAGTAGKVKDISNVQGAIFEEMMNREVERRIKHGSDLKEMLPKDVDPAKVHFVDPKTDPTKLALGEAMFVKGDRIKGIILIEDPSTKKVRPSEVKLSDGMILLRDKDGIRAATVFEGKSGERRASDLHRVEAGKEPPSVAEKEETARVKKEIPKGKVIESELGGQVRKTVERLSPIEGSKTTDIKIDGKRVAVRSSPKSTLFLGVVPKGVDISASQEALAGKKGQGVNFGALTLQSSEADIKVAASKVVQEAQAGKPWPLKAVKTPNPPAVKKTKTPAVTANNPPVVTPTTTPNPPSPPAGASGIKEEKEEEKSKAAKKTPATPKVSVQTKTPNISSTVTPDVTPTVKQKTTTTVKAETAAAKTAGKAEGVAAKTLIKVEPPSQSGGSGGKALSTAASAAQRTYTSLMGQVSGKLMQIASKDPEMADAIADINKLIDAHAFVQNPKQFTAQYISNYLINSAFSKFSRQLAADEAQFFSTYPDVQSFYRRPLGYGMGLNDVHKRYHEASRNLRLPSARKTLATVFMMLDVTDKTPQTEIDRRIRMINEYLAKQPEIGKYVKEYDDAKVEYAFGLALVRVQMDNLSRQLGELPAGFADDIHRRGDALYKAASILDDYYKQVFWLTALPGGALVLYMFQTLSDGFSGLGKGLHLFAYQAGARQGEYKQEIPRLEARADQLNRLRGAFDVIYPQSPP